MSMVIVPNNGNFENVVEMLNGVKVVSSDLIAANRHSA